MTTHTDWRALCARMADELDHYRQLLMDDRHEAHALATEARARLAQPEPQGRRMRSWILLGRSGGIQTLTLKAGGQMSRRGDLSETSSPAGAAPPSSRCR